MYFNTERGKIWLFVVINTCIELVISVCGVPQKNVASRSRHAKDPGRVLCGLAVKLDLDLPDHDVRFFVYLTLRQLSGGGEAPL